jgi:hypothetical protein
MSIEKDFVLGNHSKSRYPSSACLLGHSTAETWLFLVNSPVVTMKFAGLLKKERKNNERERNKNIR